MNNVGKDLKLCSQILLDGGVVSFPTETVMGLAVIYDNFESYNRLNKIKGRPESKPYSLMLGDVKEISKYAYINEAAQKLIDTYLPGPLTLLLKAKENVPSWVTHNTGVIGIRVPKFEILNNLLDLVKKPLLVPSANPSNFPPALTVQQVLVYFDNQLDYIVMDNSKQELPSTIVDVRGDSLKIVREGQIKTEEIQKLLGENL
ncbi:MAG: threonylcarbamoyl-AMP synthase [Bacilli bacterium]|nr:threonylcarbamoyl-AMP synthase [Bacilli bacterium]